jgi:threonine aldolase
VLDGDPTVLQLEQKVAELLGKEAAIFVPTGTMANLIAVSLHCRAGEQFFCEATSHVAVFEQGGHAQIWGVVAKTFDGQRGIIAPEQFENQLRPDNCHFAPTRAVFLENTHNYGGGRIYPVEWLAQISQWAKANRLTLHLDGARLMNAVVATGIPACDWSRHFDTVSLCFSKGLGAPVGSALAGPEPMIALARRRRKVLGGGMRQSGVLAAAAIYALDHHIGRLHEDHENAKLFAERIAKFNAFSPKFDTVDTNIVFFEVAPEVGTAQSVCRDAAELRVLMHPTSLTTVRVVTHLGITKDDVSVALERLASIAK